VSVKIDSNDLNLPFKIKDTIYYVEPKIKKVIELNVVGFQIYLNAFMVDCLIKDVQIRQKLGYMQMSLNLKVEQNIYTNIEEADSCLKILVS
jgi:hypothetical protein